MFHIPSKETNGIWCQSTLMSHYKGVSTVVWLLSKLKHHHLHSGKSNSEMGHVILKDCFQKEQGWSLLVSYKPDAPRPHSDPVVTTTHFFQRQQWMLGVLWPQKAQQRLFARWDVVLWGLFCSFPKLKLDCHFSQFFIQVPRSWISQVLHGNSSQATFPSRPCLPTAKVSVAAEPSPELWALSFSVPTFLSTSVSSAPFLVSVCLKKTRLL